MEFITFLTFIIFIVLVRIAAGHLDVDRIEEEINLKGGELISTEWAPFGTGWFGSDHTRIYQIRYIDNRGNKREAFVKTSMFSGVYFTNDKIVGKEDRYVRIEEVAETETEYLAAENRRLQAEIERLKKT